MLNVGGKLYRYILNKRLTQWSEGNKMLNEAQAGFRQGYSTIDHVFTLDTLFMLAHTQDVLNIG